MDIQWKERWEKEDLLARLMQVLAPIEVGTEGEEEAKSPSTLARHLFVPPYSPDENASPLPPVRLLKNVLPPALEEGAFPASPPRASPPAMREAQVREEGEGRGIASARPSQREIAPSPLPFKKPVEVLAKDLTMQVRQAIVSLTLLEGTKPPFLREMLKKLKPLVDQLIDAVARVELETKERRAPEIEAPLLKKGEKPSLEKPEFVAKERFENKERGETPVGREAPKRSLEKAPAPLEQKQANPAPISKEPSPLPPAPPSLKIIPLVSWALKNKSPAAESKGETRAPILERVVLSGAPYLAPSTSRAQLSKKKKKNSWEKEEERGEVSYEKDSSSSLDND